MFVGPAVTLTLSSVTIANGVASSGGGGGGIYNYGTLVITATNFYSNAATAGGGGAINSNSGMLTVTNSAFNSNTSVGVGGGIVSMFGTATISNSTFYGNRASTTGGGIYSSDGTLDVANTTFYSNTADTSGGGIYNLGTAAISNTTFFSNSLLSGGGGGGGIMNGGTLTMTNSTLAGNGASPSSGGGIYRFGGTATLRNTIVAYNTAGSGANCNGAIANGGNNLDSGTSCGWGSTSGSMSNTDPKLGPLANNGGATQTMALSVGSPAIDTANPATCPATDQRGIARPLDGDANGSAVCDIGALEVRLIIVNTLFDTVGNDGSCSLREAITAANTNVASGALTGECPAGISVEDAIGFSVTGTITLGSMLPIITDTVTINGPGAASLTISGNNVTRAMQVNTGKTLNLSNVTIANGNPGSSGGGIYNLGMLTISNTTFYSNTGINGGGLFNSGSGIATIANTTFYSNTAPFGTGGGIYSDVTLNIINSTIYSNTAATGGGIYNFGALTVTNSTVSGNSATTGGGISGDGGTVTLRNTIVANSPSGGNCSGSITNGGNNIDSGTSCSWGSSNGSMSSADPKLGPLANNGGATQTMALLLGSPAVDGVTFNAPNSCPSTDQRGRNRPFGTNCDIGA
jgi:CSLREA domain-containing protein